MGWKWLQSKGAIIRLPIVCGRSLSFETGVSRLQRESIELKGIVADRYGIKDEDEIEASWLWHVPVRGLSIPKPSYVVLYPYLTSQLTPTTTS